MKNFDEIYTKICIENLKETDYNITIDKNLLNHHHTKQSKHTNNISIGVILITLGILLLLLFLIMWIILSFFPDTNLPTPLMILTMFSPLLGAALVNLGRYASNFKNKKVILQNPNQKIFHKISNTEFDKIRLKGKKGTHIKVFSYTCVILLGCILGIGFHSISIFIFTIFSFLGLLSFILMFFYPNLESSYTEKYKTHIIASLIKNYDNNLRFSHTHSIKKAYYDMGEFEDYDIYSSNDYIYGNLNGFIPLQFGDVCTKRRHTKNDTTDYLVFSGLFSVIKLPTNLNTTIKIRSDKNITLPNNEHIQLDSQEFEKNFDVFSKNKLLTIQLLTSDIMDYMINFKLNNNINFEFTLKNSFAYLRIHCNDMFEAKLSKNAFDYDTLYTYYKFIDFICELNRKIFTSIKEKNI